MPAADDLAPSQSVPRPTRRGLLGAGGAAAAAGVGAGLASLVGLGPVESWAPSPDTWPLADYDPARTAHSSGTAPPRDPAVAWVDDSLNSRTGDDPSLVVGPERVYAAGYRTVALDRTDGSVAWGTDAGGTALALHEGRLLVAGDLDPPLRALDPADGTRLWTAVPDDRGTALTVADGTVFLGGASGVYAYTAGSRRKWSDRDRWGEALAVVGGHLLASDDGLRAYRRRTLLDVPLRSPPGTAWRASDATRATGADGSLVVGFVRRRTDATGPALSQVDPASGAVQWTALGPEDRDRPAAAIPCATTATRCLVTVDRTDPATVSLAAYRLADGRRDWSREFDQRPTGVAVAGNTAIVGTAVDGGAGGSVRALEPVDGTERWRVSLDAPVRSLAPVDGTVFVATGDERVRALR